MRAYRVVGHELVCDLFRSRGVEAASNVNHRQFLAFALVVCSDMSSTLTRKVGLFGVCLRVHGYELTRSHRHRPGD
jgi:hypothetical protein